MTNDREQSAAMNGTAAAHHAETAQQHAQAAQSSAHQAEIAAAQAVAAQPGQPNWIYAMVIVILGAVLVVLTVAIVIATLTSGKAVDTTVVSAATLIADGLIGVLAPSPQKMKP